MKTQKITIRDRIGERPDITGYSLDACARRMFGRRCSILAGLYSATGTVYLSDGRVIGEVAIHTA